MTHSRVNVSLPVELHERVRYELPNLVLSHVLVDGIRAALDCDHAELECPACSERLGRDEIRADAQAEFFRRVMFDVSDAVRQGVTGVGAAMALRESAAAAGVDDAERSPLPRPPRSVREEIRDSQPTKEPAA